ncbi:flavin reductase [Bradyrhizobium sp. CW7]|uniref:flavin reductase family protein n=1 Tax=Bradyrhizobium sp. CW7 TaxID=2782688 RepID=UPI001FF81B9F|nr:flavin reductase family protein [Bradyrhizobium sp. CW7]MCK1353266.1 flavin reductase [Bradyrhizobium sp. CW7]
MTADILSADSPFRSVMRKLASSVVVITARSERQKNGLTATAMCSLSTDPQSILICVNKDASATEIILHSRCFAVNVLAESQQEIATLFSTPKLAPERRFSGACWHELKSGAPVLADALASLDCEVATHFQYGTHYVIVGRVLAMQSREGLGLLYCNGQYRKLKEPT